MSKKFKPKHLGRQSQSAVVELDLIPWDSGDVVVQLDCSEFTSHCPVTKQPDFGRLEIRYCPRAHLVETKSLKLYLWQFRDRAEFNEQIVARIAKAFCEQVNPMWVAVTGVFNTRGGISVRAEATRRGKDIQ